MMPRGWGWPLLLLASVIQPVAAAEQTPVVLKTAASFAVLGGQTVTNTGPTVVTGDLGVSPGTAVTGFPPGTVNGTQHSADTTAAQAQSDLTVAYDDAAGRAPTGLVGTDLGGQTLAPGVYKSTSGIGITGTLVLDGKGDPNAVFIFQAASTLVTASSSVVKLIGQAQACNVFWQVGSSSTHGTDSAFAGTVMALASISVQTRASIDGRALARNGQVSLDSNTVTRPTCAGVPPTTAPMPPTTTPPTFLVPPATLIHQDPFPASPVTQRPLPMTPTTLPRTD